MTGRPLVIGVCGFTGAGKSSAIAYLAPRLSGEVVYVGQAVKDEVARRGLAPTPENERVVRIEMRQGDPAALAKGSVEAIEAHQGKGSPVLIDAVMSPAERDFYVDRLGDSLVMLAIEAPLGTRIARVTSRPGKEATAREIILRDITERTKLRLDLVIEGCPTKVTNDRDRAHFHDSLFRLKGRLAQWHRAVA